MAELVVAFDFDTPDEALRLADRLKGTVAWAKVGMELFTTAGPSVLEGLTMRGFRVFLDLKFYDIPNTVGQAVRAACAHKVGMLTLHCQGGRRMCLAAREAVDALADVPDESRPLLFGVTALTSFAEGEMPGIAASPSDFALTLAGEAMSWRLDGVVCSGHEAGRIKKACPGILCLCPGIRPAGSGNGDQRRVMTPALAVQAGADYLVVGRPVTRADDPLAAARAILAEMNTTNQS